MPGADPGTPGEPRPGGPDEDPQPTFRDRVREHALALTLAFVGIVISTVVAAVASAYLDIWSTQEPPPGAPRISAGAEVWWDLASEERAVVVPATAVDRRGEPFDQNDPMSDMDELIAAGGINTGTMRVRLILTNFTKVPASITGVRARIEGERAMPAGTVYRCGGSQGGSDISKVKLDLNRPELPAQEYGADGEPVGQYPSARIQVAAQGDPAYFDVEIRGGRAAYDFGLEITYRQGDQEHRLHVDQGGGPFVLAPDIPGNAPALRCDLGSNTWENDK